MLVVLWLVEGQGAVLHVLGGVVLCTVGESGGDGGLRRGGVSKDGWVSDHPAVEYKYLKVNSRVPLFCSNI